MEQQDIDSQIRLIEAQAPAKEIASKSIGRNGLFYIFLIVLVGVGSSYFLSESAITAVMTMIGGALVAIIQMLKGITDTVEKQERPEFKVIQNLIERLGDKEPMQVEVGDGSVTVSKGGDTIKLKEKDHA
jgi:hypothetical protein